MTRLLVAAVCWPLLSFPVAVLIGRWMRRRDVQPAPVAPAWSQAAIDAEFDLMKPGLVTADVFALDALLNRRARGEWAA